MSRKACVLAVAAAYPPPTDGAPPNTPGATSAGEITSNRRRSRYRDAAHDLSR